MTIPISMSSKGYLTLQQIAERRCVMIGTEGEANTGKSEFGFSAPGPIASLALDRNIDGVVFNNNPPRSRREDIGIKLVLTEGHFGNKDKDATVAGTRIQSLHQEDWKEYHKDYIEILDNPDVATVLLDGDSDSWELQRLAEFGTLSQIPSIMYDAVNAARRRMIRRAYDSGKNIIATNKLTDIYTNKKNPDGTVEMRNGKAVQEKSGELRRQGFADHKYLYQIQLRHLFKPASFNQTLGRTIPTQFGLKILECKPNMDLKGLELWGSDCNFKGLVSVVYPHIDPEDWFQ